jgi:hypothetical protein
MRRPLIAAVGNLIAVLAVTSVAVAQQTIEGTVTSAKLTACDPRPGGCEGSLLLAPKAAASGPVTILWVVALMVGLLALGVPDLARAEMKVAILKVKGMVCPS